MPVAFRSCSLASIQPCRHTVFTAMPRLQSQCSSFEVTTAEMRRSSISGACVRGTAVSIYIYRTVRSCAYSHTGMHCATIPPLFAPAHNAAVAVTNALRRGDGRDLRYALDAATAAVMTTQGTTMDRQERYCQQAELLPRFEEIPDSPRVQTSTVHRSNAGPVRVRHEDPPNHVGHSSSQDVSQLSRTQYPIGTLQSPPSNVTTTSFTRLSMTTQARDYDIHRCRIDECKGLKFGNATQLKTHIQTRHHACSLRNCGEYFATPLEILAHMDAVRH